MAICLSLLAYALGARELLADGSARKNDGSPVFVQALAVDPGPNGTVYAGTSQGIYRSSDHGQTWQPIGSNLGRKGVNALAIDPTDSATLYAGIDTIGVYKSMSGGAAFAASSAGLPNYCVVTRIVIARSDPSTLYLAGCGLYRSTDAGKNWVRLPFNANAYGLAVHPSDSRRLIVGTDWGRPNDQVAFGGIFLTDDGGDTWHAAATQPSGNIVVDLQIDPSDPARMYAALAGVEEIARSEDGGETWIPSTTGYQGNDASAIAIDQAHPENLYATSHAPASPPELPPPELGGIYRSGDAGRSWIRIEESYGEDIVAADATGRFVYFASYSDSAVSVLDMQSLFLRPRPLPVCPACAGGHSPQGPRIVRPRG